MAKQVEIECSEWEVAIWQAQREVGAQLLVAQLPVASWLLVEQVLVAGWLLVALLEVETLLGLGLR